MSRQQSPTLKDNWQFDIWLISIFTINWSPALGHSRAGAEALQIKMWLLVWRDSRDSLACCQPTLVLLVAEVFLLPPHMTDFRDVIYNYSPLITQWPEGILLISKPTVPAQPIRKDFTDSIQWKGRWECHKNQHPQAGETSSRQSACHVVSAIFTSDYCLLAILHSDKLVNLWFGLQTALLQSPSATPDWLHQIRK